ncbi:MAG TPA: hypothetical protein VG603_03275 [Chitinophagales bacterium]|nr:hypothetical protein [Chitinophagales bacterium]
MAKQFIENVDPQLNRYLNKLSMPHAQSLFGSRSILDFLSQYDDFTISANKFFRMLRESLEMGDEFIEKLAEAHVCAIEGLPQQPDVQMDYIVNQLEEVISLMRQMLIAAGDIEKKLWKLTADWERIRALA